MKSGLLLNSNTYDSPGKIGAVNGKAATKSLSTATCSQTARLGI